MKGWGNVIMKETDDKGAEEKRGKRRLYFQLTCPQKSDISGD